MIPEFFTTIIAPDFSSFYWSNPAARQAGFSSLGFLRFPTTGIGTASGHIEAQL